MFEKVKLVCLSNEEGKKDWLGKGFDEVIFSADQLRSNLLIGEALPEKIVFDGRLLDFIHLFPMRSIDESCAPLHIWKRALRNGQTASGNSSPAEPQYWAAAQASTSLF